MALAEAQSRPAQTPSVAPPTYASQELPLSSKYQSPPGGESQSDHCSVSILTVNIPV